MQEGPKATESKLKLVSNQEKISATEKEFNPEAFNDQIKKFISERIPEGVQVDGPIKIDTKHSGFTYVYNVFLPGAVSLLDKRGVLKLTLYSYLNKEMLRVESPNIEARGIGAEGKINKIFHRKFFDSLPEELKIYLEKEVYPGKAIKKITVDQNGKYEVHFVDSRIIIPVDKPGSRVVTVPRGMRAKVSEEDQEIAEQIVAKRKEQVSKKEGKDKAIEAKNEELLKVKRVLELVSHYEGIITSSPVQSKKEDAERNLLTLADPENLTQYFKERIDRSYDSKDVAALVDIERINDKYATILRQLEE